MPAQLQVLWLAELFSFWREKGEHVHSCGVLQALFLLGLLVAFFVPTISIAHEFEEVILSSGLRHSWNAGDGAGPHGPWEEHNAEDVAVLVRWKDSI